MKRMTAALACLALCAGGAVWAAAPLQTLFVRSVVAPGGGTDLTLDLDGQIYNADALKVLLDGAEYPAGAVQKTLFPESSLEKLSGFRRVAGTLGAQINSWDHAANKASSVSEGYSNALKFRRPADVYVSGFRTEARSDLASGAGSRAVVLVPNVPIGAASTTDVRDRRYALRIDGTGEVPLEPAAAGVSLQVGRYYLKNGEIVFPLANFQGRPGSVALTVDGVPANYFGVGRDVSSAAGASAAGASDSPRILVAFTPGESLYSRVFDFVNAFPEPFKMGRMDLFYLQQDASYELSFTATLDADHVPFSSFTFAGEPLATSRDPSTGKVLLTYLRRGKGSDFSAMGDLVWSPSGLKSEGPFRLTLGGVTLRRLGADGAYRPVAALPTAPTASFAWAYRDTGCWDGGAEYCNAAGHGDPSLTVDFSASGRVEYASGIVTDAPPASGAPPVSGGSQSADQVTALAAQAAQPVPATAPAPIPVPFVPAASKAPTPFVAPAPVVALKLLPAPAATGSVLTSATGSALTSAQRRNAERTTSSVVAWCAARSGGNAAKTKKLAQAVAAAVEARLPDADPAKAVLLRAVVDQLRAKYGR